MFIINRLTLLPTNQVDLCNLNAKMNTVKEVPATHSWRQVNVQVFGANFAVVSPADTHHGISSEEGILYL